MILFKNLSNCSTFFWKSNLFFVLTGFCLKPASLLAGHHPTSLLNTTTDIKRLKSQNWKNKMKSNKTKVCFKTRDDPRESSIHLFVRQFSDSISNFFPEMTNSNFRVRTWRKSRAPRLKVAANLGLSEMVSRSKLRMSSLGWQK